MNKEERRKEIITMADAIGGDKLPSTDKDNFILNRTMVTSPAEILAKKQSEKLRSAAEIIATKKLEIPKCRIMPVNGRIYVVSVAGSDMKSPGGLILPPTFGVKKNEQVENVKRYFVVAWDTIGIPPDIQDLLTVGIEVLPFLPQNAEEWDLPRVIDWQGNNIFEVLHYTELAGVSSVKPEKAE